MPFMINRRLFLQSASASLALASLGAHGLDIISDGKKRRVGVIGTGWYGKSDVLRLIQVAPVDVVAICDVDTRMRAGAAKIIGERQKSGKKPREYGDYRKMLAEEELDIVTVGTPDHWHAMAMIAAVEAGHHVYVQKPISVDVLEGEAMLAAARKHNRVVQVGTQRRSTPHLIDAKKKIIDTGMLGKIAHVEICCYYHMRAKDTPPLGVVPDYFDYEMWTGPAPMMPFRILPHKRWWRAFMEYGNGIVGDMCIHMLDATRWMLDLGWPKSVSSTGGIYVDKDALSNISDTQSAVFEFDDLTVSWQHRTWGDPPDKAYPWAMVFYGDKGTLKASVNSYDFIPSGKGEAIHQDCLFEKEQFPEDVGEENMELHAAPATRRHMLNFLEAIETGGRPVADIEQGHISTASSILANLSMDLGRTLRYDHGKRVVVDDQEATERLRRPYRGPWEHPMV